MAEEKILGLFDFLWFERGIFSKTPSPPPPSPPAPVFPPSPPSPAEDPFSEKDQIFEEEPQLSRMPTFHSRSLSDQMVAFNASFLSDLSSPGSVFHSPKLETILSGKDVGDFAEDFVRKEENGKVPIGKKFKERERRSSKSLSELEFEELKGFMDLGFVFSEEDKDSSLVSILPGLQRLGKKSDEGDGKREKEDREREERKKEEEESEEEEEEENVCRAEVSRPYLSEAWDVLDSRKQSNPLMNWRIPSLGNEIDMKDHLRFWAHTVASTVR